MIRTVLAGFNNTAVYACWGANRCVEANFGLDYPLVSTAVSSGTLKVKVHWFITDEGLSCGLVSRCIRYGHVLSTTRDPIGGLVWKYPGSCFGLSGVSSASPKRYPIAFLWGLVLKHSSKETTRRALIIRSCKSTSSLLKIDNYKLNELSFVRYRN